MMPERPVRRFGARSFVALVALVAAHAARGDDPFEDTGLRVPEGFRVTRYADDSLAHDIYSMTIDTAGRVVVSGPGYVKILVDEDNDGRAERAIDFAGGPRSGAQGLFFLGRDLLCTGDEGLIRYTDEDGDDRADGPPETFLKVKTGSEHHAHAIRRGPDGWWYLIAGNFAEVTGGYATEKTSPIKAPQGGVILRLKPDLSGGEIVADGFRNAYDFDFNAAGELFAYDSDGERDSSLPWYLPTRLFHVLPGGEHGWISESWKRPDYLLDSAPVVTATGRGSPTGVVCYRHTQFPAEYRGGLFVLDWTFGRVLAVPLERQGAGYAPQTAKEFATASGELGFAPTDADVGTDGSLYVSVGGRGTRGTVYRIAYMGGREPAKAHAIFSVRDTSSTEQKRAACIDAPQPASSWSRARWAPLARQLGAQAFLSLALDEQQPASSRLRAVEILADVFDGLPAAAAEILSTARDPELRARAVWSLGARLPEGFRPEVLVPYLNDTEPLVRRRAVEAAARVAVSGDPSVLIPSLARCLGDDDRLVRLAAARIVPDLKVGQFKQLADTARKLGWKAALTTAVGYVWRTRRQNELFNAYAVDLGRRVLEGKHPAELKLEAVRLVQMALGDLGGTGQAAPVFEGYSCAFDLAAHERGLDPVRIAVASAFPAGQRQLDLELARLAAMLAPLNDDLLAKLAAKITPESHPVDDIHYLIAAARLPATSGQAQREAIARGLIDLDRKLLERKLVRDNNWNDRIGEMFAELSARDPELASQIIGDPAFGRPAHVVYMGKLDEQQLARAVAAFTRVVTADPDYPWNNDVVFIIGYGKTDEHRNLVRKQFEKFDLRMAVLMVLAERPEPQDRERFARGLESGPIEILNTCVGALERLPAEKNDVELVGLVKLLRRLGSDKSEFPLRERVVKLLERNSGKKFDFVFGTAGYRPQPELVEKWTEWVCEACPDQAAQQLGAGGADLAALKERLAGVAWDQGSAERGKALFVARGCAQCHGSGSALGPDLAGVTGRFSRDDLFVAIALPNRDVSPRYQTTLVETTAGKVFTGLVVYESVEGILLRDGTNQTFRIDAPEIESKRSLPNSLMPEGLLKDLSDRDVADLYAYLKSLAARTAALDVSETDDTQAE